MQRADQAAARLESLLADLRERLSSGDFGVLDALSAQIAAALETLAAAPADPDALHRIRALADRNAAALAAAARGVRAARQRLRDVADAGAGLGTYDSGGRRQIIAAAGSVYPAGRR
jgi:hypothetical protein